LESRGELVWIDSVDNNRLFRLFQNPIDCLMFPNGNLNVRKINDFYLIVPAYRQAGISERIILKQIDLFKEYRQTLISNVVTGKVRVK